MPKLSKSNIILPKLGFGCLLDIECISFAAHLPKMLKKCLNCLKCSMMLPKLGSAHFNFLIK